MAGLAKAFGVLSLGVSVLVALLTVYVFAVTDWAELSAAGSVGETVAGGAILFIGAMAAVSVLFGAVGAAAYVVSEQAEEAERRRWARRIERAEQADRAASPYGAAEVAATWDPNRR